MWGEFPGEYWEYEDVELERAKEIVSKYFTIARAYRHNSSMVIDLEVYDRFRYKDPKNLEEIFNDIYKKALDTFSGEYVPILREGKEFDRIIFLKLTRPIKKRKKGLSLNIVLLIVTIITTTLAGAINWISYSYAVQGLTLPLTLKELYLEALRFENLINGLLYFSIPLLVIVGVHETGHYLMSRRLGLDATLPYFIPVPPTGYLSLGTLGAFISVREPMKTRRELILVGAAGPISGFVMAVLVTILGLYLMKLNPVIVHPHEGESVIALVPSLLFEMIFTVLNLPGNVLIHPLAFAGWIGILVTGINLLPIGQLDGGHIFRGLFKDYQKYFGYATLFIMFLASIYYPPWLIFLLLIVFLGGVVHPPPLNDVIPLDKKTLVIGIISVLIFILCFIPVPFLVVH